MCNLHKNEVNSGDLLEKCANIVIKLDHFKTAESKTDLTAGFTCVVGKTHHVRSCHYCLRSNWQPVALNNVTLFLEKCD